MFRNKRLMIISKWFSTSSFTHACKQYSTSSRCGQLFQADKQLLREKVLSSSMRCSVSTSSNKDYKLPRVRVEHPQNVDLTRNASDIFKHAMKAVHPRKMVENVLKVNEATTSLKIQDRTYALNRNVFLVGMGKAVLGMARVVEDVLAPHVVTGIISIPKGLQEELILSENKDILLSPTTKIQVYEGAANNEVDEASFNAAKAMHSLVSKLIEKDILIVLCSAGGSALCPYPEPPITLEELHTLSRVLVRSGATVQDLNNIRKNVEVLKGGGLAKLAKPAQVICLMLSSIAGDPMDLIAGGPTCPSQPTPHHCLEILQRLRVSEQVPLSCRKFLEKEDKQLKIAHEKHLGNPSEAKAKLDDTWNDIQNIVVGNNSLACQAAAEKASDMGYMPMVFTDVLAREAKNVGCLFAKLAKFIMLCYDRKASLGINTELSILEVELVSAGLRKDWLNEISSLVDLAHSLNRNICIISGGESFVHVKGSGVGGNNLEVALSALIHLKQIFRQKQRRPFETEMSLLCAHTGGRDGITSVAGSVINLEFLDEVEKLGVDMETYLENNDSYSFFKNVSEGRNILCTQLTGACVMDMAVLLIQRPQD